jgi:gliding motility-associated-like protein
VDISVIPELIFKTTASYCEDVPTNQGGGIGNGTIELTLDPAGLVSESVVWTKEADLSGAGTGNYVTGLYPGWYGVEVMTTKGCVKDGRVEVPTDIRNYNLITQNQDNKNDAFVIDCISRFPNNNVKVFNRSGILVYDADGYDNISIVFDGYGKNGLYMAGNMLPVGTYFYIIDKRDGSKPRTGYLELVR